MVFLSKQPPYQRQCASCHDRLDHVVSDAQHVERVLSEYTPLRALVQLGQHGDRIVPVPMWKIGAEDQRLIGVQHLQHLIDLLGLRRLVHRLRADANVLAEVFAGQPLEPGRLIANGFPVRVPCATSAAPPTSVALR